MFRTFVIAVTLTGMTLCQFQCMGAAVFGAGVAKQDEVAKPRTCCCCCPATNTAESPNQPCVPSDDGDCQCQGICGGAVMGEAVSLTQLMLVWMSQSPVRDAVIIFNELPTSSSQFSDGEPTAPGVVDGRALRILHASLLT